jgi:hypothetical protein
MFAVPPILSNCPIIAIEKSMAVDVPETSSPYAIISGTPSYEPDILPKQAMCSLTFSFH